jgi:uncharacterized protein YndB with AHSA1/START domain
MRNGSLETVDDRPAVRLERRLPHPVERVWRAVSEPSELAQWFVAPVEWTPATGETFTSMEQAGEVTEVDPPNVLAWTWGGEAFRFELRPDGDGCVLVFTHVFDDRDQAANYASGWDVHFARLDAHLAGAPLSEEQYLEPLVELTDFYSERFGIDPEIGRRAIAQYHPELITDKQ